METINSLTNAASKVLWGEGTTTSNEKDMKPSAVNDTTSSEISKPLSNSNERNTEFGGEGAQSSVDAISSSDGFQASNQRELRTQHLLYHPDKEHDASFKTSDDIPKPSTGNTLDDGDTTLPTSENTEERTGEKYEKSNGLPVDTSHPKVTEETDHLMEKAGITDGEDTKSKDNISEEYHDTSKLTDTTAASTGINTDDSKPTTTNTNTSVTPNPTFTEIEHHDEPADSNYTGESRVGTAHAGDTTYSYTPTPGGSKNAKPSDEHGATPLGASKLPGTKAHTHTHAAQTADGEKRSLGDKIKEKLHLGHHDK